ncbi:hypothetical protein JT359_19915, partial [Candidatus Poribacteria bacterium]|nr:hypothetical protein [Candidatus Poribacteria bacterium]
MLIETMISFEDILQRCKERYKKPLLQRKTVVTPALYNLGYSCHLTAHCAYKYPVLLTNLEDSRISFMPIGRAPGNDIGPRELGGERFLKRQRIKDWEMRRWHESWGIQIYTGTPSELDGARWHDFHFTYNAICDAPDAVITCIETLTYAIPNPLLTITKSGGIRFSCRIPEYLHSDEETSKFYIYKHTPTTRDPEKRNNYLEIYGDKNYSRWDARYEIVHGNLLDPPVIAKEVVFAPIDALRVTLHDPAPEKENEEQTVPDIPISLGSQNLDLAKNALIKRGFSYLGQEKDIHRWTLPHSEIDNHYISLWEDEGTVWVCASTSELGIPTAPVPITDIWIDTGIVPLKPQANVPISDKIRNIREGKLSPLAIKRPSPQLEKTEHIDQIDAIS